MTVLINRAQQKITKAQMAAADLVAKAQLDVSERQLSAEYLNRIISATKPQDRANLIEDLDIALLSRDAVPIALRFAYPNNYGSYIVAQSALHVLQRMKVSGRPQLEAIASSGEIPESEIAKGLVGRPRLLVRASDVDDYADVWINGVPLLDLKFGEDSGWVDVTPKLVRGSTASVYFVVTNGHYGGCGGRLRISAGIQQLDIQRYYAGCPADQKSWDILYDISVAKDGDLKFILAPQMTMLSTPTPSECTIGCE